MDPIIIIAAGVASVLALVIFGRLLHQPKTVAEGERESAIPDGSVGRFVQAVNRCESEKDPEYFAAVEALRADSSAAAAIEEIYSHAVPELRLSLLLAAAETGPAARAFLASVASSPFSTRARTTEAIEESRLRLVALDGLERLALKGEEGAWDNIEHLALSADRAVQVGAVAALKFAGKTDALTRLRERMGPERRYLFDVERPDVSDVAQASDPSRYLARFDLGSGERPHPDAGEPPRASQPRRQRRGSPTIGGKSNG